MLITTTPPVPLSNQIRQKYHQSRFSLFRPFLYSSKLYHTICPDVFSVIEAWRCERIDSSQLAVDNAIVSIACKAIRKFGKSLSSPYSTMTSM